MRLQYKEIDGSKLVSLCLKSLMYLFQKKHHLFKYN
jgi:hypothetical protein